MATKAKAAKPKAKASKGQPKALDMPTEGQPSKTMKAGAKKKK